MRYGIPIQYVSISSWWRTGYSFASANQVTEDITKKHKTLAGISNMSFQTVFAIKNKEVFNNMHVKTEKLSVRTS